MSSPDEQALIEFVNTLPPTTNPYSAVANHLIQLIEPPAISKVGRWLERVILLLFVVIFIQCCCLIYTRIKAKIFRGFRFDELGLLSIDVPSVCAVAYLIYSSLVITDSILDEIFATDYRFEGGRIMLFGCKFIVILNCSW
ncbi:hypothetical protein CROQUDRAFT_95404 [Cronartium quercuum f. sp. fusiforme G11]|uniref:Uncharacterized protein n=1 Tax=Cronartium quercuum f. sp. fusiforme G11 TaxID=708437 RepID=A0A9P6NI91_9BASI|nr:hypothetical protein CROQUDRAFT_95404 [Cronartium quercuum f. sp. fusiforme G11]